jgi:NAD(P)-dependent dehydrogenase (short-subunit alcohol dehydrogenase family)
MYYMSLKDKVILITGASSGIGKLAAQEFLKEGARIVMTARSDEAMQGHLRELSADHDHAIALKTDVSDYDQVKNLAQAAIDHFGHIDIWINNAAITSYGLVEEMDIQDIQRIINVNQMGYIHGMKAALKVFKKQGYGNIINIVSAEGIVSMPLRSAYASSNHGILGFSSSLRQELIYQEEHKRICITDILTGSIDTPLVIHNKSYSGEFPQPLPPVYDPEVVVKALIKYSKKPEPMVTVGLATKMLVTRGRLMPITTERQLSRITSKIQQTQKPKPAKEEDNLYTPMSGTQTIRGGLNPSRSTPLKPLNYVKNNPGMLAVLVPALGLLSYMALQKAR